jgi:peptidoglycan/LPS O-acetylase OafA/YrhL
MISSGVRLAGLFQRPYVYSLTITRLDALAWGALVAGALRGHKDLLRRTAHPALLLSGAGLVYIAFTRFGLSKNDPVVQDFGFGVISVFCAAVVGAVTTRAGFLTGFFSNCFLRLLGRYSYAMYVVNWPLVYWTQPHLVRWVTDRALSTRLCVELLYIIGTSAVSFLLALLSWYLIEERALRLKRHFAPSVALSGSVRLMNHL